MRSARAYLGNSRLAEEVRHTAAATVAGAVVRAHRAVVPTAPQPISGRMTGVQARSRNSPDRMPLHHPRLLRLALLLALALRMFKGAASSHSTLPATVRGVYDARRLKGGLEVQVMQSAWL